MTATATTSGEGTVVVPLTSGRDGRDLATVTRDLRAHLTERVTGIAARARAGRPAVDASSASLITGEVQALTAAHDTLRAVADALRDAATHAAELAADAMHDVLGDTRQSVRVPAADGGPAILLEARAGVETKVVDEDTLLHVLGAAASLEAGTAEEMRAAHAGVRALREVLPSRLPVRVTALEGVRRRLDEAGQSALAARLDRAWHRGPVGDPRPRLGRAKDGDR